MPLFVRAWQFNDLEDSDSQHDFDTPSISSGIWSADTTGNDPYLYFNTGYDRGINADIYTKFICRIKLSPNNGANTAWIYFFPKTGGFFSSSLNIPQDAQWHIVEKNMAEVAGWAGYINNFRLDPVAASGVTVEIDYAYFLSDEGEPLTIVNNSLPDGEVGIAYSQTLSSTNFLGSLGSWSVISGSLPSGLSLSSAGVISGTPTTKGISSFTVQIYDDLDYATKDFTINIVSNTASVYIANPSFAMTNVAGVGYTSIDDWTSTGGGIGRAAGAPGGPSHRGDQPCRGGRAPPRPQCRRGSR